MRLDDVAVPQTPTTLAAQEVARRYSSPALFGHCMRSYLWSAARGQLSGLRFDAELLYVAAMLHDLGLTAPFDSHELPFEEAGGHVAWVFGAGAGWPAERCARVAEVIERHMWPLVDPRDDVEGHLLEMGTGVDISGNGVHLLPATLLRDVLLTWPRLDLGSEFAQCLRGQAGRKPSSRAADLVSGGIAEALRDHPLERG